MSEAEHEATTVRIAGELFGDDLLVTHNDETGELEAFVIILEPEYQETRLILDTDVARALVHGLIDALTTHPDRSVRERAMLPPR